MVSQKDIAKALNMTQQAVSAALRADEGGGTVKVAPETRQLVVETAKRLGYRSNRYASVLKSGRSRMIAVLHGKLTNAWLQKREYLHAAVLKGDYIPWIAELTRNEDGSIPKLVDDLLSSKIEGVVVAGAWFAWQPEWFWKAKIPVVSLQGRHLPGVPFVGPEKIETYCQILRHLYEQGCRRPMICVGAQTALFQATEPLPPHFLDLPYSEIGPLIGKVYHDLLRGFHRYVEETRRIPDHPFCAHLPDEAPPEQVPINEFEKGRMLARAALKHQPDALVFANDSTALGALYECRKAGINVPRDLCITGFNDEDPGRYSLIPLTTALQPVEAMTAAAIRKLIGMIEQKTLCEETTQLFPCTFLPRSSSLYGTSEIRLP